MHEETRPADSAVAPRAPTQGAPGALLAVRVGVDLTAVADVEQSIARLGDRYVRRLFTDHEVASSSTGGDSPRPESLAARFAAKEAVVKVLRPSGARPEWRDIEVRRDASGACDLVLSGQAAAMADAQAIRHWSVSLSHEAGMAVAVVVAQCDPVAE